MWLLLWKAHAEKREKKRSFKSFIIMGNKWASVHENHIWCQMEHVLGLGNFAMLHFIEKECKCGLNNVKNT